MEHNQEPSSLTDVLAALALDLEQRLHEVGWDQPSTLWALNITSDIPEEILAQSAELGEEDAQMMGVIGLENLAVLPEDPATSLLGKKAPDEALGVLLVTEGWTFPEDVVNSAREDGSYVLGPPSEHPRRVELRQVVGMMKDGSAVYVRRHRGEEPRVEGDASVRGRIVDALRCYLGAPSSQELPSPQRWHKLLVLGYVTEMAVDIFTKMDRGDQTATDLLGEMVSQIVERLIRGGLEELVGETPLAALKDGPHDGMTWSEMKQSSLEIARENDNAELAAFLEWADDVAYFNTLDMPENGQSSLQTLKAMLPQEHIDRVTDALNEGGLL